MIKHEHIIRVRYADTDKMGFVYYGNYATFFEVGRVETFRELGISYDELEKSGIGMPVTELHTKFIKPARYDDLLTVVTTIKSYSGIRVVFEYEVLNEEKTVLTTGETTLIFLDLATGRPRKAPINFDQIVSPHFGTS